MKNIADMKTENSLRPYGRLLAVTCALILSCATGPAVAAEPVVATTVQPKHPDSIARLLAGLPPSHADHAELVRSKAWTNHSATMQKSWAQVRDGQLAAMKTWRTAQLPKSCPVGDTLFYPFGGPDFLNAWVLFPECDTFVMFGLEPIGVMPDPAAMTAPEFAKLLTNVRESMVNLFARNYFVTSRMKLQLQTEQLRGVLPVLTMSMVLAGAEVVGIGPAPVPPAAGKKHNLDGVTIEFRVPGSPRLKRVIFYSFDASDKGIADYPQIMTYLRGLTPSTTLIKSASYLLHITEFRKMRTLILETSAFLVQDDTGVPFNDLIKRGWDMRAYGTYVVPIPPFEKKFQPELAAIYDAGKALPLPFRFGYHLNLGDNRSNLMIGRRAPTAAKKTAADR